MAFTPRRAISTKEILVVLVIIALLMAVAIPNFMRSRTRAKIAMVKEDLREMGIAVESYRVDFGHWVREYSSRSPYFGDPIISPGEETVDIIHWQISTPIAYLHNGWKADPFAGSYLSIRFDRSRYTFQKHYDRWKVITQEPRSVSVYAAYKNGPWPAEGSDADASTTHRLHWEFYGDWRVGSVGPGASYYNNPNNLERPLTILAENIAYDPTNGLHSQGNIWHSNNVGLSVDPPPGKAMQPPIQPGLLGAH